MRGLKLLWLLWFYPLWVASFTDAWIETNKEIIHLPGGRVASFTDAWIETFIAGISVMPLGRIFYRCVDWNLPISCSLNNAKSHLLQMRGLKPCGWCVNCRQNKSHLLQMRGLKLITIILIIDHLSRIFYRCVDWNSVPTVTATVGKVSHLLQMRGLKPVSHIIIEVAQLSHLLQMRGLKHKRITAVFGRNLSHLLQMRGLKL